MAFVFQLGDRKVLKKQIKDKLKRREIIDWERNQELHDLAYSVVQRRIEVEFPKEDYDIYHIKLDKNDNEEFLKSDQLIPGYILLIGFMEDWRPKKTISEWTTFEKEIFHILSVKTKAVCNLLLDTL